MDLMENANRADDHLRGAGLYLGLEFSAGPDFAAPAPEIATAMINALRDRGILIGAAGRFGNVLKIRLPLCITIAHADELADSIESILQRASSRKCRGTSAIARSAPAPGRPPPPPR
jgi:4-aminobutyrate aminotransferase-like enzyme